MVNHCDCYDQDQHLISNSAYNLTITVLRCSVFGSSPELWHCQSVRTYQLWISPGWNDSTHGMEGSAFGLVWPLDLGQLLSSLPLMLHRLLCEANFVHEPFKLK